jgi:hypothetical protein
MKNENQHELTECTVALGDVELFTITATVHDRETYRQYQGPDVHPDGLHKCAFADINAAMMMAKGFLDVDRKDEQKLISQMMVDLNAYSTMMMHHKLTAASCHPAMFIGLLNDIVPKRKLILKGQKRLTTGKFAAIYTIVVGEKQVSNEFCAFYPAYVNEQSSKKILETTATIRTSQIMEALLARQFKAPSDEGAIICGWLLRGNGK